MGMTDAQFKSYIRFILGVVKAAEEEEDKEKRQKYIDLLVGNLEKTLED